MFVFFCSRNVEKKTNPMPPKRKRGNAPEPFRSKQELIPGLLNDVVIDCIVGNLPRDSIFYWTKFRTISKLFKRFIEHKFPNKPKYVVIRLLLESDKWIWWKDVGYHGSSETRLSLNVKENVVYYKEHKGKTFGKQRWLRYVFISPNQQELSKAGYVRAEYVERFIDRVCQVSRRSSVEMKLTPEDLRIWLMGAINKRTESRKSLHAFIATNNK